MVLATSNTSGKVLYGVPWCAIITNLGAYSISKNENEKCPKWTIGIEFGNWVHDAQHPIDRRIQKTELQNFVENLFSHIRHCSSFAGVRVVCCWRINKHKSSHTRAHPIQCKWLPFQHNLFLKWNSIFTSITVVAATATTIDQTTHVVRESAKTAERNGRKTINGIYEHLCKLNGINKLHMEIHQRHLSQRHAKRPTHHLRALPHTKIDIHSP